MEKERKESFGRPNMRCCVKSEQVNVRISLRLSITPWWCMGTWK